MTSRLRLSILAVVAAVAACSKTANERTDAEAPSELTALEGAMDIRGAARKDGGYELSYSLQVDYPAEPVIASIRAAVAPDRWRPLERDWLNPEQRRGPSDWQDFTNGIKKPDTMIHAWSAEWRDAAGNVLLYSLSYESAVQVPRTFPSVPDNRTLRVSGMFFQASLVDAMRKQLGIRESLQ